MGYSHVLGVLEYPLFFRISTGYIGIKALSSLFVVVSFDTARNVIIGNYHPSKEIQEEETLCTKMGQKRNPSGIRW